jgi:hypothetical protein
MRIDADTAVIVCAGPSLDRMTAEAWEEIGRAGAVVAVNGAAVSHACIEHGVRFTCLAAMDLSLKLGQYVPALTALWRTTAAWRVASTESHSVEAESYIVEVDEEHGIEGWSDDAHQGYKGGSTAMIIGNWLGNAWPDDDSTRTVLRQIGEQTGKAIPRRGFRKFAFVGLDMHPDSGRHAHGAGIHSSGFADSAARYQNVCRGWEKFCGEAARRGIEVVNLTPGTALEVMPRVRVPQSWVSGEAW